MLQKAVKVIFEVIRIDRSIAMSGVVTLGINGPRQLKTSITIPDFASNNITAEPQSEMVVINLAYSAPINPSGATPILTEAQIWNGLKRKVRHADEFVAPIIECHVVSEEQTETGKKVTREVTFEKGTRGDQNEIVKEIVYEFEPSRVDFHQPDGSNIFNLVSVDQDGNLIMTYAFEWRHPEIAVDSEQVKGLREKYFKVSNAPTLALLKADFGLKMAKGAVEGSIDTIRRLVKEEEL